MPSFAPLVIADNSTATPVDHTFDPTANVGRKADFTDRAPTRVADWPKLSVEVRQVTVGTVGRTELYLTIPVPVEESGSCCVDTNQPAVITGRVVFQTPIQATTAQLKSAYALLANALDNASVKDAFLGSAFY